MSRPWYSPFSKTEQGGDVTNPKFGVLLAVKIGVCAPRPGLADEPVPELLPGHLLVPRRRKVTQLAQVPEPGREAVRHVLDALRGK